MILVLPLHERVYGVIAINQLALTSVVGSNIFFNSKHSVGVPTGSATWVGIICVGRAGAGINPGLPTGKLIACWAGADPFTVGKPMLQCLESVKIIAKFAEYKRKIFRQTLQQCQSDPASA